MDDLEALFSDQRQPAQSLPTGIFQRVDEMRRNGCTDKLAWSNNGSLIHVTEEENIEIVLMKFSEPDRRWVQDSYRPVFLQETIQKAFQGKPIAHVSCNPFATEMVVADICGRLVICAPFVNANKIVSQKAYSSVDNEANRLVGLHWLHPVPPKKTGAANKSEKVPFFPSASKHGNRWVCGPVEPLPVIGPVNPWGKSGFITVTTIGKIILYYNIPDHNWFQEEQELFKPEEPASLLTHAAFCSYKENETIMVAIDGHKNVRIVSVKVLWTQSPGQQREHPQLKIDNLVCFRLWGPTFENPMSSSLSGAAVSFVRLLYDRTAKSGDDVLPTMLVGYHNLPVANAAFGTVAVEASTTILRYEIRNSMPELEPTFNALSTKQNAKYPLKAQINLSLLEDVKTEGIMLDLREQSFGRYVTATFSDGRVQFFDSQLAVLELDSSPDKVSNLAQIGFSFDAVEPCLYNSLSSHCCLRATMCREEQPKFSTINASVLSMGMADGAFNEKAAAAFVLEHIGKGNTTDCLDIMAATRAFVDQLDDEQALVWKTNFLRSLAYALQLHVKMHEQGRELVQFGNVLQRFLSIQEALGHGTSDTSLVGDSSPRTASSHLAWILQNLRQHMVITVWVLMMPAAHPGQTPEIRRPEVIQALGHYSEWCGMLAEWTVGQVMAANRALNYARSMQELSISTNQIMSHIPVSSRVASALLMLPLGRSCLKLCFTGVRQLSKIMETMAPHDLPESWRPVEKSLQRWSFMHGEFIRFIDSIEGLCSRLFTGGQTPEGKDATEQQNQREMLRRAIEVETLIKGQCEGSLVQLMGMLVTRGAWDLRKSCEENSIVFADYTALEPLPTEDGGQVNMPADVVWDGNRKIILGRRRLAGSDNEEIDGSDDTNLTGMSDVDSAMFLDDEVELSTKWMTNGQRIPSLRTCVRCGNIMEDQTHSKTRQNDWLSQLMRLCYCGGHWVEMALQ